MDQSAQTAPSNIDDQLEEADAATTTEILRAISDHYASCQPSSSPPLPVEIAATKQKEGSATTSPLSSEMILKKEAAYHGKSNGTAASCRHDKGESLEEEPVDDATSNGARHSQSPQTEHQSLEALPQSDTTEKGLTETSGRNQAKPFLGSDLPTRVASAATLIEQRHNPYASKLRSSYNQRHAEIPAAQRSTENNGAHNPRDSFQTVAPPTLRPATRANTHATPGATAVYPSDPVRQFTAENMDRIGVSTRDDSTRDCSSLTLTTSSDNYSTDAILIQARLVRDSETVPRHRRHHHHRQRSSEESGAVGDFDLESGRTEPSQSFREEKRSDQNITQAVEVVNEDEIIGRRRKFSSLIRDRRVIAVLVVLLITIVCLALGTKVSQDRDRNELHSHIAFGNNTLFLTPATISENEEIASNILGNIPSLSSGPVLTPGTPQRIALNWLVNNNVLRDLERFRIIQRFALAAMYFSTGGLVAWTNRTGWLSNDHECTWFQTEYFAVDSQELVKRCSDDGQILALILQHNGLTGTLSVGIGLLTHLGTFLHRRRTAVHGYRT